MTVFTCLLILHVAAGFTALFLGVLAMLSVKGGVWHRRSGLVFLGGMTGVFVSAVPMSILHHSPFLLTIAFFSFFLAFTGYRRTKIKVPSMASWADKTVMAMEGLVGLGMIGTGIWYWQQGNSEPLVILSVFGASCVALSVEDWRYFNAPATADPKLWLYQHVSRMGGAYIAAFTAFVVVNIGEGVPWYIGWLGPSVVGSVLITWTIKKLKKGLS